MSSTIHQAKCLKNNFYFLPICYYLDYFIVYIGIPINNLAMACLLYEIFIIVEIIISLYI